MKENGCAARKKILGVGKESLLRREEYFNSRFTRRKVSFVGYDLVKKNYVRKNSLYSQVQGTKSAIQGRIFYYSSSLSGPLGAVQWLTHTVMLRFIATLKLPSFSPFFLSPKAPRCHCCNRKEGRFTRWGRKVYFHPTSVP